MTKLILALVFLLVCMDAHALRLNKPPKLSSQPTPEEINVLNKFLEDVWNLTNGRFELDVVTTTKTNADNGEIWIIDTGGTGRIQWKTNGEIFTTP